MRYSELKQRQDIEWMIDPDDLEVYADPNDKRVKRIKDPRTHQVNGIWQIYPIAHDRYQVFIACPYCANVHCHGYGKGDYAGNRVPHCKKRSKLENYDIREPHKED